jgi:hypothetical protein
LYYVVRVARKEGSTPHLRLLVDDILNGRIPDGSTAMHLLLRGRGVALKKPNGQPRPIGVGEALLNLSLSCLIKQQERDIRDCLSPDDFGFRVPDGVAKAAHRAQAILAHAASSGAHIVCIKIDITNAYGTTARMAVLRLLLEKLPGLVRPFVVTHGSPHEVHFAGADHILQAEGLTQGDPAAPAYSQLLYGSLCQEVRANLVPDFLGSFFDDIFILADFETALACFKELRPLFDAAGMQFNMRAGKTQLFSNLELSDDQREELDELGLDYTYEGVMIVGTPVGTEVLSGAHSRPSLVRPSASSDRSMRPRGPAPSTRPG